MNSLKAILLTLAILNLSFIQPHSGLTDPEREYAVNLLQETRDNLLNKVKDLTPEQLNFKADATSWSVAECVEHIAIAENNIFGFAQSALKEPADPSKRSEIKTRDEDIVKMITDRSNKVKTSEAFEPSGKFGSFEATVEEFKTRRENSITYVKTTTDDLRNHYNDFPFGKMDTYQTIIFMAAHSRRHTDQIQEVLDNPSFPKKRQKRK